MALNRKKRRFPARAGVTFAGFPGVDECGRRSVAMTNDHAGIGHGRREAYADPDTAGQLKLTANSGNYGFSTCQPVFVRNLKFHASGADETVSQEARWQFSMGLIAAQVDGTDTSGTVSANTDKIPYYGDGDAFEPTRHHEDSTDYGFSECYVVDEDGSLATSEAATCDGAAWAGTETECDETVGTCAGADPDVPGTTTKALCDAAATTAGTFTTSAT